MADESNDNISEMNSPSKGYSPSARMSEDPVDEGSGSPTSSESLKKPKTSSINNYVHPDKAPNGRTKNIYVHPGIPQRPHEINNYDGAGIIPCTMIDGKFHVLLQKPRKGKKADGRWYDLGGKKGSLSELPSDCAARKFTKYTYGLFSVDSDWDDPNVERNVLDLYRKKENVPLLSKSGTGWAKMWLLQSDAVQFYSEQFDYHLFLVPVPFIPADIFAQVGRIMDKGKREIQWIPHDILSSGPLAGRVQNKNLFRQLTGIEVKGLVAKWSQMRSEVRPNVFKVREEAKAQ